MAAAVQSKAQQTDGTTIVPEHLLSSLREFVMAEQWPFLSCGITDTDMLVTDQMIIDALGDCTAERQTKIVTPESVGADTIAGVARVFVLCLSGELAYVRKLKQQFSGATVISVTYGEGGSTIDLASMAATGYDVTAVISSQCSGTVYLRSLIEANKLAESVVSMVPVEAVWARCQHDFNMVRWVAAKLQGLDAKEKRGHVFLELDLDLVGALDTRGLLTKKNFKLFLVAAEARLVFMFRRNRADQIALIETGSQLDAAEPDAEALLPAALDIIGAEARFEKLFSLLPDFRTITFEELVESPIEVVKMLTSFFERKSLRNISVTDPVADMVQASWKDNFREKFNNVVVEFLGISKNAQGSYQTKTEQRFLD